MTSGKPPLGMRGNRFPPLTWETMSPEQAAMADSVLSGKRGSMQGPYNVLLRSPDLGQLAQAFGAHTRFQSSLPLALNELAILLVARAWTSQFVWWAHRKMAVDAGLDEALVLAIAKGAPPPAMNAEVAAVFGFCSELLERKQVSDEKFAAAKALFGERGVVDLMGSMGYYTFVCMSLNVDQYPLPDGVAPELGPL